MAKSCFTVWLYKSISRVSGAYDHKMHQGKVLDYRKSYARDLVEVLQYYKILVIYWVNFKNNLK